MVIGVDSYSPIAISRRTDFVSAHEAFITNMSQVSFISTCKLGNVRASSCQAPRAVLVIKASDIRVRDDGASSRNCFRLRITAIRLPRFHEA